MKRCYLLFAVGFFVLAPVRAQDSVIAPSDNLVVDAVRGFPRLSRKQRGGMRPIGVRTWQIGIRQSEKC